MNLPSFVLPYQRSPSRCKTLLFVFTHTIPAAGGVFASTCAGFVVSEVPAFWLCAGAGAAGGVVAADGGAASPATRGVPLSMGLFGTPSVDRSPTDLYGRTSMLFLAVSLPNPSSLSRFASAAQLT